MKRKRIAIITAFAAASITFGSLMATIGHHRFNRHCHSHAMLCSQTNAQQQHNAHH
ncbi:MAG: hypothetical protein IT221_14645 [Fluviicola sp.]|nr:hypothetical protein [Fluviicola sp.]